MKKKSKIKPKKTDKNVKTKIKPTPEPALLTCCDQTDKLKKSLWQKFLELF
jgi:hypothetical protein